MPTTKLQVSGRRKAAGTRQRQTAFIPEGQKFTTALTGEETLLARALARAIAIPGQMLTLQDVLRIGLANLGILHRAKLETGSDQK